MDREVLRLEILKLVYRKDQSPEFSIETAKTLEEFLIQKPSTAPAKVSPKGAAKKNNDNADILS